MINKIFVYWIMIQLILLAFVQATIYNRVIDETYQCPDKLLKYPVFTTMCFPLVFFLPETKETRIRDAYCECERNNKRR